MREIEILVPDFEIEELVNKQVKRNIVSGNDMEIILTNAPWNRVRHWLTTVNCATITAWPILL